MSTSASTQTTPTAAPADHDFEAALRQAAQGVDSGQEVSNELLTSGSSARHEEQAAGAETGTETDSEGSDHKDGTELTAEQQQQAGAKKDATKPGDQPQETAYAKAKKDQERFDRNWKKFQEERAAFEAKQQQIAERERQLAEREQRLQQQPGGERRENNQPLTDQHGFTATQYTAYADKCEKEGKFDLADAAREAAKQLCEREQQAGTQREQSRSAAAPAASTAPDQTPGSPEFKAKWNQNLAALTAQPEFADLGKKDSALFKATAQVLHSDPRFSQHNDGIQFAAQFARLQLEASSVPTLRTQLQEQTKELEKLRKATSPGGGNSESRGRAKTFEEMSPAEQEAAILKDAEAIDAS